MSARAIQRGVRQSARKMRLVIDTIRHKNVNEAYSLLKFSKKRAAKQIEKVLRSAVSNAEQDAQKTNAYQQNRNLLLSKSAHADSIPGLEIMANDVRCTHGATLGQVDREQLFYLMTRGLTRSEAERLIVRGFFQDVLDRVELEPVRDALAAALEARIPQA